jgi:hypothetical protein
MGGQHHAPATLPPKKTRYPLYMRLGRPQSLSGHVRKISPLPGFDPRTVQPVASSQKMKLYNDQLNAQVFNLFYLSIYFCLTCFEISFTPSSEACIQLRQYSSIIARALTPYSGDLNHCRSCTPASEDGLKESPKHVGQK